MVRPTILLSSCVMAALVGSTAVASDTAVVVPADASTVGTATAEDPGTPAVQQPAGADGVADSGSIPTAANQLDDSTAEAPDEPAIQEEVRAESAELEQVRDAELKARLTDRATPQDPAARAASRLGLESPLRLRLRDAFSRETGPWPAASDGRIPGLPEIDHGLRHLQAEYDIPMEVNEQVIAYVRFFQTPLVRKHFIKWLDRSSKYIPVFRRILRQEGLPQDTVFLAMIESGFANHATSRARAVGPWQFIPPTGKRMGLRQDFWVDERRDPEKAAHAAARYLKELFRQTSDWRLAWAGYNAGVGKIYQAQRRGQQDFWSMARGRVLKQETKGYVPKLMAAAIITKHPEAFGFSREEIQPEKWQDYEEVPIQHATPISAIARAAEVTERELLDLNPELRRTCTPPRPYVIKVPEGSSEAFARNWPAVSESVGKLAFAQHRVKRGESVKLIAKAYRVDARTIVRMNGLHPGRRIKPGTDLVVPLNALARTQAVAFAAAEPPARARTATRARNPRRHAAVVRAASRATPHAQLAKVAGRVRATVHVRSGDSLWGIAQRFGVAVEDLCRWNGIRSVRRYRLQVGRELVVYPRRNAAAFADQGKLARDG